ncbi:hypothetical protein ACTWPT_25655 [Nonomuraea sp. 3N208]|uniref:hypothetical protein n=1 Tax=Nonomuraea sp. 3N208 TaxID=3457421 RepID=UPI003FD13B5F
MDELAQAAALERQGAAADLARAVGFMRAFARRKAPREVPVLDGFAVLDVSVDDDRLGTALAETRLRGADVVAFRGVRAPDGQIAARAS